MNVPPKDELMKIYDESHTGIILIRDFLPSNIHENIRGYVLNKNQIDKYIKLPLFYGKNNS